MTTVMVHRFGGVFLAIPLALVLALAASPAPAAEPDAIAIATDGQGIGFDDLRWSPELRRVIVPAGRLGSVFLIDPAQRSLIVSVVAFATESKFAGGHDQGTTSADASASAMFAVDRNAREVVAIDPAAHRVTARAPLASSPDYVRWVSPTRELWVTEPDTERIEIFRVGAGDTAITKDGSITVTGGPESLVIDAAGGRAFAHLWKGKTVAIDLKSRRVTATWSNRCDGSRGIAWDERLRFLFVGCAEGKAVVMDPAKDGAVLATASAGEGVDVIAYDSARRHLYLPGARSATLTILSVGSDGALATLGTAPTARGAHCVTQDGSNAYVCDPERGRILVIPDAYPSAP